MRIKSISEQKWDKFYFYVGLTIVFIYLFPLFMEPLYVSVFDNLDSTIPSLKILAHSGKIFASNSDIIPNMMNGLPRSSYGSEFNIMLWLYYFFEPKTAYIINQVLIHFVAYFSMYIFLKRYIVNKNDPFSGLILLAASLYFALIPFFSPEGLSIPLLPLVTYSLLNIKNNKYSKLDWIILILLPLYTDFIFVYVFYIFMAGIYLLWDSIVQKKINLHFLFALIVMGTVFLLREYRLVWSMFFDSGFISHRTEFDAFFKYDILDSFRTAHVLLLNGHHQHLVALQSLLVIPVIIIGMLLSLSKKHFTQTQSMVIWILIATSFAIGLWKVLLGQLYTLPILTIFVLIIYLFTKYSKIIPLLMLLQIMLAMVTFFQFCQCMHSIVEYIPILKMLNITRIAFVQPLIWGVLLAFTLQIFFQRLHYTVPFVLVFIFVQVLISFNARTYSAEPVDGYARFSDYYATKLFNRIKKDLPPDNIHIVNFGIEPSVSLYNGYHTIDGYSTDYPLSYKHKFRKVIAKYLSESDDKLFDYWGSKAYIMQINGTPFTYKHLKGTTIKKTLFNSEALCDLGTDYIFSAYKIETKDRDDLKFINMYKGGKTSWDIYVYKVVCK